FGLALTPGAAPSACRASLAHTKQSDGPLNAWRLVFPLLRNAQNYARATNAVNAMAKQSFQSIGLWYWRCTTAKLRLGSGAFRSTRFSDTSSLTILVSATDALRGYSAQETPLPMLSTS